ncbi:ABC transporter ATP-binding protein [Rhodobium gokarnense]|uniref:ABC transport system ATP-binding protein n=1 Tax=Rhodobium gokarnense TaxID=364296 RepID=A0ABT3HGQ6_9HYPH|nr:ABC transporter ATP-binding protein [Rhodobium gokarnense]MCW2309582.1 putative ABC transport system ATP-binding protein [Rhodobium gokarnense]
MDKRIDFETDAMFATDYSRDAKPVIETDGLTKRFGDVAALDDVDICIREGEFVAIMGPSGSGKTTLLNILSCLDTPSAGAYRLDGLDVSTLTEPERAVIRREKIGLVFQQFHLIPYLTALENVMLAQHYHSVADADEAMEILQSVGLGARASHLPSQLSGGEQQRVCIARALVNEPAIILADEPTGNLDEENEKLIIELLQRLHGDGRTIALVTHNPEMGALADRTIRLRHGKLDG